MSIKSTLTETIQSLILQDFGILYRQYFEIDLQKDAYSVEVDALVSKAMTALLSEMDTLTNTLVDKLTEDIQ